jgi:uncharacterized membrane protein YgdD (TMEM256/DUF423 family)
MQQTRILQILAGFLGMAAVACGAFGAHGLKESVSPEDLEIWKTGAHYHLVHAVLLAWLAHRAAGANARAHTSETGGPAEPRPRLLAASAWCFVAGILVFAGSLYLLVLTQQRWLGAITPLGGLSLIAGWLLLAFSATRPPGKPG